VKLKDRNASIRLLRPPMSLPGKSPGFACLFAGLCRSLLQANGGSLGGPAWQGGASLLSASRPPNLTGLSEVRSAWIARSFPKRGRKAGQAHSLNHTPTAWQATPSASSPQSRGPRMGDDFSTSRSAFSSAKMLQDHPVCARVRHPWGLARRPGSKADEPRLSERGWAGSRPGWHGWPLEGDGGQQARRGSASRGGNKRKARGKEARILMANTLIWAAAGSPACDGSWTRLSPRLLPNRKGRGRRLSSPLPQGAGVLPAFGGDAAKRAPLPPTPKGGADAARLPANARWRTLLPLHGAGLARGAERCRADAGAPAPTQGTGGPFSFPCFCPPFPDDYLKRRTGKQ